MTKDRPISEGSFKEVIVLVGQIFDHETGFLVERTGEGQHR